MRWAGLKRWRKFAKRISELASSLYPHRLLKSSPSRPLPKGPMSTFLSPLSGKSLRPRSRRSITFLFSVIRVKLFDDNILVVDDDPDIREVLKDRLESLGYRVLTADSGKEGLDLLEKECPQLILLDIEMPALSGIEVLKEIRKRALDLTVVMITAYGTIER